MKTMEENGVLLAIIGAGEGALPIINKAKEMGVLTVAFARNDSLAKDMVDIFVFENRISAFVITL